MAHVPDEENRSVASQEPDSLEPSFPEVGFNGKEAPQSPHGEEVESDGPEIVLRVPESLTTLPAVDQAMPLFSLFSGIVGRKRARYKIALLKSLQSHRAGRWKIREVSEAITWMEPSSVSWLMSELRDAGVLTYDPVTFYYRLSPESRVVVALLDALTVPEIEPRRLIRALNKAMSFAIAAGAKEDVVLAQFKSAITVLRSDLDDVKSLIDDFSESALLEAAGLAQGHVMDMRDLLDEHEAFFVRHLDRSLFLDADQEALDLIAQLGRLSADVIDALTGRADDRMRLGLLIDRGDIREFLAEVDIDVTAGIVEGIAAVPPSVRWIPVDSAFDSLYETLGKTRAEPPPLPEPMDLERQEPDHSDDFAQLMGAELQAIEQEVTLAAHLVRESWEVSVGRHSALIEAYSRNGRDLPDLEHLDGVDEVERHDVWRVSKSILRPRT